MRRGAGGVCVGPSGRSGLRGVCLGGGCRGSFGVPPGHRVRGLLRPVRFRPWGVRPALCGARALPPPRGRVGGPSPRALPLGGLPFPLCGGVLVWWWLRLLGVGGVRSGARAPGCALGSGGAVVRVCGVSRWRVVGAPVGAPFFPSSAPGGTRSARWRSAQGTKRKACPLKNQGAQCHVLRGSAPARVRPCGPAFGALASAPAPVGHQVAWRSPGTRLRCRRLRHLWPGDKTHALQRTRVHGQ